MIFLFILNDIATIYDNYGCIENIYLINVLVKSITHLYT